MKNSKLFLIVLLGAFQGGAFADPELEEDYGQPYLTPGSDSSFPSEISDMDLADSSEKDSASGESADVDLVELQEVRSFDPVNADSDAIVDPDMDFMPDNSDEEVENKSAPDESDSEQSAIEFDDRGYDGDAESSDDSDSDDEMSESESE